MTGKLAHKHTVKVHPHFLELRDDDIDTFLDDVLDDAEETRLQYERVFEKYAGVNEGKFWEYD